MKNSLLFSGIVMFSLLLTGCGAALVGGAAVGGYHVGKDERSMGEIASDARITSAINAKYVGDNLVKAMDINVDTHRGAVTLHGHVDSQYARDRAVTLARSVKGVVKVVPRLEVLTH